MASSSYEYWKKREHTQTQINLAEEAAWKTKIDQVYDLMTVDIQKQINDFYLRYASSETISMAEAQKKVSEMDVKLFSTKAKQYVKEKNFSKEANRQLRLYNATMRINRLELLKAYIGLEATAGFDELEKTLGNAFDKRAVDELRRQAGILGESVTYDDKTLQSDAKTIVEASFNNATWKNRVWNYCDNFTSELGILLTEGIIQGRGSLDLARYFQKYENISRMNAERLMRTELARIQVDAQMKSYERNGYTQFIFIAEKDSKTCSICSSMDKKVFDVAAGEAGLNMPPMHPNCRCSTAAYVDRVHMERELFGETKELMSRRADIGEWPAPGKIISKEQLAELIDYGKSKGIDVLSFNHYDGDIELIKSFIDGIEDVANDYPAILRRGRRLQLRCSYQMEPEDYAETTNNCINLNGNAFRNRNALRQDYLNQQKKDPFFVDGTTYKNIVHHEVGHLIIQAYGLSPKKIVGSLNTGSISTYAKKSSKEAIAESFSAFYAKVDNKTALQIKRRCDKIIKKRRAQNDS